MNQHLENRNDLPSVGTVLTLQSGKIREETNRFAEQLQEQSPPTDNRVQLDLDNVEYVASEELGALVSLHKKVCSTGGQLSLINVRPQVSEVLSVTRLDTLLEVHRVLNVATA